MAKAHLKLVAPDIEKRTVGPRRLPNNAYRAREHLTEAEVERLLAAAKTNRYGHRDATMILTASRHGLRAAELVELRWEQVEFETARLAAREQAQEGDPATHPIGGRELRALRRLKRETKASPFMFVSERGAPFTVAGFQKLVARAGDTAGFAFKVHPTCCAMPAALRWPTPATIQGRCRPISGTGISSTQSATPNSRPIGSSPFGRIDEHAPRRSGASLEARSLRMMPIDRALMDSNLLGAALGDGASWSTWLAVLRAAFALPMWRSL
jgi:type 1 fimbriae regulatory protein FimB/type 1 fimbriae regulatory protein FimE